MTIRTLKDIGYSKDKVHIYSKEYNRLFEGIIKDIPKELDTRFISGITASDTKTSTLLVRII